MFRYHISVLCCELSMKFRGVHQNLVDKLISCKLWPGWIKISGVDRSTPGARLHILLVWSLLLLLYFHSFCPANTGRRTYAATDEGQPRSGDYNGNYRPTNRMQAKDAGHRHVSNTGVSILPPLSFLSSLPLLFPGAHVVYLPVVWCRTIM